MTESGNILENAEVDFLIDGGDADDAALDVGQPGQDEQAVTMRGDLDQINLSDIFQTLALTKMEGVLRVRNPLEQRQVYCNDGYVRILVPDRVALRRLGQRLVQAGLLQPEQLRAALLQQRREPMPLGALLVRDGILSQDQVDEIAGMQVAEDLFALFTWRHGTFEFWKGAVANPALRARFDSCPEFEVSSLLLEVARRADEWETILEALGSMDEVPARIAEAPAEGELSLVERSLLFGADGRLTYRQLAEQTTQGLFEVGRVARNLSRAGCLANIGDDELIAVAESYADAQHPKQALMLLQTLRDRGGDRTVATLTRMVGVLNKAGERRLAGTMLLEVAQQNPDPSIALPLARQARDLAPNDAATLSFLRTTLLAHAAPDAAELEQCNYDLIDALLAIDKPETALEIIAEVRQQGTLGPQLLMREARARQRGKDNEGACKVLLELAEHHRTQGDKKRALEAYDNLLRIDRTRKDVVKIVRQLRQTRTDRIVRFAAIGVVACLLGGMGFVLWEQQSRDAAQHKAGAEIDELLRSGDRVAARERLVHWTEVLGESEQMEDLKNQVDFADASERTRLVKLARKRMQERLTQAAATLGAGDLRGALQVYSELYRLQDFRVEVTEVARTRIDAVLAEIEQTAKVLGGRLPAVPNTLLDRDALAANLADLQSLCRPALHRIVDDLRALHDGKALPSFLAEETQREVGAVLTRTRDAFDRARALSSEYATALERNATQRRLDPLFKEARHLEQTHDFAGALKLYQEIDAAQAVDEQLRAHFRDRVQRNTTICRLLGDAADATEAGDFATAQGHYRTLRTSFPDVPFDRLVRLPLVVESQPSGAAVRCNGSVVGQTPCTIAFLPAENNRVEVALDGFLPEAAAVTGDTLGALRMQLLLQPRFVRKHENLVEAVPALDADGAVFVVDRGGMLTALAARDGRELWSHRTGDLSGLLSQPFVHREHVIVASLDGDLRAFDRKTGRPAWTLPDLPTEVGAAQAEGCLLLATTARRLALVDLATRQVHQVALPEMPRGRLGALGKTVVWCGDSHVAAHALPSLDRIWEHTLADCGELEMTVAGEALVVADDRGQLAVFHLRDGKPGWRRSIDAERIGPPLVVGDQVLVGCPRGVLRFHLADGSPTPAIAVRDEALASAPARFGNRLLLPLRSGAVQVCDLASGQLLYLIEGHKRGVQVLAADTLAAIAFADRRLHFFGPLR